jgi:hypothetical protein
LNVLKATFCVSCKVGQNGKTILALLSSHSLDLQCSHFKMTMIHNFKVVMCDSENNLNPMTQLWCKITISPPFNHKLLEYMKLVEITTIQVLGFVEDKHTFSTLSFMKNQLWNWFSTHLDLYSQQLHSITFLTIRPLPSCKAKPATMLMRSCKQVHGSSLGFLEDLATAKKS